MISQHPSFNESFPQSVTYPLNCVDYLPVNEIAWAIVDCNVKMKLHENGRLPSKAHEADACYDCYAAEDLHMLHNKRYTVSLGFSMAIPTGWQAKILPRSGLSLKGLIICNAPGTIDSGYLGIVKAIVMWNGATHFDVAIGTKLCQMEFQRVPTVAFTVVEELDSTERGSNGFGSTGL